MERQFFIAMSMNSANSGSQMSGQVMEATLSKKRTQTKVVQKIQTQTQKRVQTEAQKNVQKVQAQKKFQSQTQKKASKKNQTRIQKEPQKLHTQTQWKIGSGGGFGQDRNQGMLQWIIRNFKMEFLW